MTAPFAYSFLTWNLAMMDRSEYAPSAWRPDQTEAVIRETVLRLDPDFVLFQELPGVVPFIEPYDMAPANARGQSGDIATLVRRSLMPEISARRHKNAVLTHIAASDLTLANVHLPSSAGADKDRIAAMKRIVSEAGTTHVAVIGDTNTRIAEEDEIESTGLIGARPPEPTWNGRLCKFRRDARGYTAYYTRAFHSEGLRLEDQSVLTQPCEVKGSVFHLSDHFALFGRIAQA